MSDTVCITYLLDIPRFAVSLVTIISSTYFTFLYDSNGQFLGGGGILVCDRLSDNPLQKKSLFVKEKDPCLTPNKLHHILHWPLDSSIYPFISSALSSSPLSTTKSYLALMLVPLTNY